MVDGVLGGTSASASTKRSMGALAIAGTLLALADAEWEREAARAVKNVQVRCEPPKQATETETEEQGENE